MPTSFVVVCLRPWQVRHLPKHPTPVRIVAWSKSGHVAVGGHFLTAVYSEVRHRPGEAAFGAGGSSSSTGSGAASSAHPPAFSSGAATTQSAPAAGGDARQRALSTGERDKSAQAMVVTEAGKATSSGMPETGTLSAGGVGGGSEATRLDGAGIVRSHTCHTVSCCGFLKSAERVHV